MRRLALKSFALLSLPLLSSGIISSTSLAQCSDPPPHEFTIGEKVVADRDGPLFSWAIVTGINGDYVSLKFPDGGTGDLRHKYVAHAPAATPPCYQVGDRVVAQQDKTHWKEARITSLTGTGATVSFVDGASATKTFSEIVRFPTRY